MSSFIGHSLAGLTTYAVVHQLKTDRFDRFDRVSRHNWLWLMWLIAIASIPDIDYLIPELKIQHADQTLRITHSFVGVLLVPVASILGLWFWGNRGRVLKIQSFQLVIVGLSHLILDSLTGVYPKPWLYPFSLEAFKLPFGVLPSAGGINITNYLLYRNLFIEMGVLLPLSISLLISAKSSVRRDRRQLTIGGGLLISAGFMVWAARLSR
jgi:inner membrane protein